MLHRWRGTCAGAGAAIASVGTLSAPSVMTIANVFACAGGGSWIGSEKGGGLFLNRKALSLFFKWCLIHPINYGTCFFFWHAESIFCARPINSDHSCTVPTRVASDQSPQLWPASHRY